VPEAAGGGARPSVQLLSETLGRNNVFLVLASFRVPEVEDVVAKPDVVAELEEAVLST